MFSFGNGELPSGSGGTGLRRSVPGEEIAGEGDVVVVCVCVELGKYGFTRTFYSLVQTPVFLLVTNRRYKGHTGWGPTDLVSET